MINRATWPLAIKLTLVMTVMIVLTVGAVTLLSIRREQATFRTDLEQQGELLLDSLTASGADLLYRLQLTSLQNLIGGLGTIKAIVAGWVYDAQGHVLADAFSPDSPLIGAVDDSGKNLVDSPTTVFNWQDNQLLAGKAVVLGRQTIGAFRIGLSTAPLEAKMITLRDEGLLVALVASLTGIVVSILLSRTLTEPLRILTSATERAAQGDLSQTASIRSHDEVAILANSFNTMVVRLRTTIQEMQQRTDEVRRSEQELKAANALAQESVRLKSEFLSAISHELRTPLNAILGFSDLLLVGMFGPLNEQQTTKVSRLKENGSRLLLLINDLLDLSRIEAGRVEVQQKPFAPHLLIDHLTEQMESLAVQNSLIFEKSVDPTLPESLVGDEQRLEQVIVNLVSNAIKFTREGSISLKVWPDTAAQRWLISVKDTGIGIPPHALDTIFEEFRQVEGGYSRPYQGTGLGLAITRNLVRLMGGKISVTSTLDVGSTFLVELPLVVAEMSKPTI